MQSYEPCQYCNPDGDGISSFPISKPQTIISHKRLLSPRPHPPPYSTTHISTSICPPTSVLPPSATTTLPQLQKPSNSDSLRSPLPSLRPRTIHPQPSLAPSAPTTLLPNRPLLFLCLRLHHQHVQNPLSPTYTTPSPASEKQYTAAQETQTSPIAPIRVLYTLQRRARRRGDGGL